MTEKKIETKPEVQAPPKFTLKKLRENCMTLFGVTTSTFDGAAYSLHGEYSVAEMKEIIRKWNKKEVK